MGISNYGLWKGTPTSWNGTADTDHGHLEFTDGTENKTYEADVNIMSSDKDKRLVYWLVSSYNAKQPSTTALQALSTGFSSQKGSDSLALDFIRENLVDLKAGTLLSHNPKDPTAKGDILTYLNPIMNAAVKDKSTIYLWGSKYSDSDGSSGIHDIHMNQGNAGSFESENGTYQDGGIVIESSDGTWQGIFLAFATQTLSTDSKGDPEGQTFAQALGVETTSSTVTETGKKDRTTRGTVGIEAALVNPVGPDQTPTSGPGETVYIQNRSARDKSLKGWTIENGQGESVSLGDVEIPEHNYKAVEVPGCPLSNRGGEIVLKNAEGVIISQVEYSEKQARKEGRLVYFA